MYEFNLVLLLLQQMCVFLVIAWLMSKTYQTAFILFREVVPASLVFQLSDG
jgi:LytS/YehU family sensor histidine kinase